MNCDMENGFEKGPRPDLSGSPRGEGQAKFCDIKRKRSIAETAMSS